MTNPIGLLGTAIRKFARELDRGLDVMHGLREPGQGLTVAPPAPFGDTVVSRDSGGPDVNRRFGEA